MHSLFLLFLETACSLLADAWSHWHEDPELIIKWDCCPAKPGEGEVENSSPCVPWKGSPLIMNRGEKSSWWWMRTSGGGRRELKATGSYSLITLSWQGRTTDTQGCASHCCLLLTARYRSTSVPHGLGLLLGYHILRQRHELSPPVVFFFACVWSSGEKNRQWKKSSTPTTCAAHESCAVIGHSSK